MVLSSIAHPHFIHTYMEGKVTMGEFHYMGPEEPPPFSDWILPIVVYAITTACVIAAIYPWIF